MRSFTAAAATRHLLDDDLALRSPPSLDTIISPEVSIRTLSPGAPTPGSPTLGLGLLDIFPTELIIPILCHLDIHTLLYLRTLNRHALSFIDLCPGYLPIRTHAPNILRGILAIEAGPYWTLSNLWIKLRQRECDSPADACRSKGESFAGYLCLLKQKRYCWSCWRYNFRNLHRGGGGGGAGGGGGTGPWRPGPWREIYHGWPGPMTAEFAVAFFGLDDTDWFWFDLDRLNLDLDLDPDPKMVLERYLEPRIRAELPDAIRWKVGWARVSRTDYKYGVASGTWPGQGPGGLAGKGKGERSVLLDTETVFAMAVYLGFDPEKEMKSCSLLSKQLRHCWARYVKGHEAAFLAKGREAAIKVGVDLDKVTPPPDSEKLQFRWLPTKENGKYFKWIGPPVFRPWWRYCSVVRAPWFNPDDDDNMDKMEVQWGLLCLTCAHPDKRFVRTPPLATTPDGHFCEFTVESFRSHLERRGAVVDGKHCLD